MFQTLRLPLLFLIFSPVALLAQTTPESIPAPRALVMGVEGVGQSTVPAPVLPAPQDRTAEFIVNYTGFSTEAQTAFQYAVDIWSAVITSDVPIVIDATWEDLPGNTLGSAGATSLWPNFDGAPFTGVLYPSPLADKLAGSDLDPGSADMVANFDSGTDWYYGLDGNTPFAQYDLVSVVLHEIGHGLGFSGTMYVGVDLNGYVLNGSLAHIYDEFVYTGAGKALLDIGNGTSALGDALQSDNLYWAGIQANAYSGDFSPKLYAPAFWEQGSSLSHFDEATYPAGNPHSLMTPAIGNGEAVHSPGPMALGLLEDIGWTVDYDALSGTGGVPGCTDEAACNYDPDAGPGTEACEYAVGCDVCQEGEVIDGDVDDDGVCDEDEVPGCSDPQACNYDPEAGFDDGSCCYLCDGQLIGTWIWSGEAGALSVGPVPGSSEWYASPEAGLVPEQYDDSWTFQSDGTYLFETNGGVMNPYEGFIITPISFAPGSYTLEPGLGIDGGDLLTIGDLVTDDLIPEPCGWMGLWDSGPEYTIVSVDAESMVLISPLRSADCTPLEGYFTLTFNRVVSGPACIAGCTDPEACNYDAGANYEDGSCEYAALYYDCAGACLNDADGDGVCDELEVEGCTDEAACNFDEGATDEDGSCAYLAGEMVSGNAQVTVGDTQLYTVSPSDPGNTYTWAVSGGNILDGQGTAIVTIEWTAEGQHALQVIESNPSCNGDLLQVEVTVSPVISVEEQSLSDWMVYPNPASDGIRVEGLRIGAAPITVRLLQSDGRLVRQWPMTRNGAWLSLEGVAPGWYVLEGQAQGFRAVRPLWKE